nr:GrpB family protein [Nocardia ignorata]
MDENAPAWAYEAVQVCPYDARWPARAEVECEELADLLAPWLVEGVEHVGSTAVPGLAAKPIVDVMASVSDLDIAVEEASERLAVARWCYVPPELDRRPWRRFFVKPDSAGRRREAPFAPDPGRKLPLGRATPVSRCSAGR